MFPIRKCPAQPPIASWSRPPSGPTPGDVAHLQAIGYQAWLNEQFAMAPVSNYNAALVSSQGGLPTLFLANAVTNPDQLRQRVGFALSQITVISITKLIWNNNIVPFENLLLNDAFTNYRQILGDVTLAPSMGCYLDHVATTRAAGQAHLPWRMKTTPAK